MMIRETGGLIGEISSTWSETLLKNGFQVISYTMPLYNDVAHYKV
jgi:hypothetical protein